MCNSTLIYFAIDFLDDNDDVKDYFPHYGSYFNRYCCLCVCANLDLNNVLCSMAIANQMYMPHLCLLTFYLSCSQSEVPTCVANFTSVNYYRFYYSAIH